MGLGLGSGVRVRRAHVLHEGDARRLPARYLVRVRVRVRARVRVRVRA